MPSAPGAAGGRSFDVGAGWGPTDLVDVTGVSALLGTADVDGPGWQADKIRAAASIVIVAFVISSCMLLKFSPLRLFIPIQGILTRREAGCLDLCNVFVRHGLPRRG
jgi:hypothetical protein